MSKIKLHLDVKIQKKKKKKKKKMQWGMNLLAYHTYLKYDFCRNYFSKAIFHIYTFLRWILEYLWQICTNLRLTQSTNRISEALFPIKLRDEHPSLRIPCKGTRTGHSVRVSLWYASLFTNTRFRLLYFRISNC